MKSMDFYNYTYKSIISFLGRKTLTGFQIGRVRSSITSTTIYIDGITDICMRKAIWILTFTL